MIDQRTRSSSNWRFMMRELFYFVGKVPIVLLLTRINSANTKSLFAPANFFIFIAKSFQPCIYGLLSQNTTRQSLGLWNFIQVSELTKMDPTSDAQHPIPIPNKYMGTYFTKPVIGSTMSRSPNWNSFMSTRMGPTTIGGLPHFLEEFYKAHIGNLDPKFAILTRALRECHQVTQTVFWYLEQRPVKDKQDKLLFLDRALLRNHELWNKVADMLQKCVKKSPEVVHLFWVGRRSNSFDTQHSGAAKVFIKNLVKRTIRDPRSWNLFRRSFLVDELKEYALTTNMLAGDIEDELDGRIETGREPNQGARAWARQNWGSYCAEYICIPKRTRLVSGDISI